MKSTILSPPAVKAGICGGTAHNGATTTMTTLSKWICLRGGIVLGRDVPGYHAAVVRTIQKFANVDTSKGNGLRSMVHATVGSSRCDKCPEWLVLRDGAWKLRIGAIQSIGSEEWPIGMRRWGWTTSNPMSGIDSAADRGADEGRASSNSPGQSWCGCCGCCCRTNPPREGVLAVLSAPTARKGRSRRCRSCFLFSGDGGGGATTTRIGGRHIQSRRGQGVPTKTA